MAALEGRRQAYPEPRARQSDCAADARQAQWPGPRSRLRLDSRCEWQINTFSRLNNPVVIAKLREVFPDLPEDPDERTVFLTLRELRNNWLARLRRTFSGEPFLRLNAIF